MSAFSRIEMSAFDVVVCSPVAVFPVLETSMAVTERITMTMRELDRFKVIQDVMDGRLKPWRAAERPD